MKKVTIDGNFAAANIAYMFNDVAVIYPITPSSPMAENCDQFAFDGKKNRKILKRACIWWKQVNGLISNGLILRFIDK